MRIYFKYESIFNVRNAFIFEQMFLSNRKKSPNRNDKETAQ